MREICLRRHGPKGVSAGAAGTNYYRSPRLRLRATTLKPELLGPPPSILNKRSFSHPPLRLQFATSRASYCHKTIISTILKSVPIFPSNRTIFRTTFWGRLMGR